MINIISLVYRRFWHLAVLLALLSGCAVGKPPVLPAESGGGYRSELAESEAKALYAYVEFRMLAVENRWDEAIEALRRAIVFDPQSAHLQMTLAKALLHKDQVEESIQLLEHVLQQEPDNVEGRELLGDLLGYQGKTEDAIEHYRYALKLEPDSELLRMRLAMALGRLERNSEAIDLLKGLVDAHPEAKLAQLALARFYLQVQQNDAAEQVFQTLLDRYPDYQQAVIEYGDLLVEQKALAEAFSLYRQAIKDNPRAVAIRQRLAILYLHQNRKAEALEQLLQIRQLLPNNPQVIGRVGLLHLDAENWQEAEKDFRQLLQFGENGGRNRYYLGLALLGQERYTEAIEVMAPIDENSPVFAEAVMQLAYLYRQAGQLDRAVAALQRLLTRDIQQPEIYYYLTSFYADQNDLDRATQTVAAGLKQFPNDIELLYQSAVLLEKSGQRKQALERMKRVLELDHENAEALNFIAYHHAEKGTELELALSQAQLALKSKRTGYIIDTLGWIYFKLGRYQESRKQLEEASNLLPDDPVILEHLGDLYRALTLWEQAAAAYRKSLEMDPLAAGVAEKLQGLPVERGP